MSNRAANQSSLFRALIKTKRFDETTLRALELLLLSNDVKAVLHLRSSLKEYLRSQSLRVLRGVIHKNVHDKLSVLQFFVRAFGLIGDVESCLALRYEAFVLREHMAGSNQCLRVSFIEWADFAQQLLSNGFPWIAIKVCEKALSTCLEKNHTAENNRDEKFQTEQAIEKITRLRRTANKLAAASHSGIGFVGTRIRDEAQAAVYLEKEIGKGDEPDPDLCMVHSGLSASSRYRNGIKKRHSRKLHECHSGAGYP